MPAETNRNAQSAVGHWPAWMMWFNRTWRRAHRAFKRFPPLPPASSILDIGAYRGSFTDQAMIYWHPARVWLVEAQPDYAAALREKFRRRVNCRVIHCAIASANGETELRVNESPGSSSLLPLQPASAAILGQPLAEKRLIRVPTQTLDTLFAAEGIERVDLMKVDIQGAERELVIGGRNALQKVDNLYIEVLFVEQYAGAAKFDELHALLRESGFKLRGFSDGRLGTDGALAYSDAWFIRTASGTSASSGVSIPASDSPRP